MDAMYLKDGRDKPEHDYHGCYTGLAIKYWVAFEGLQAEWAND